MNVLVVEPYDSIRRLVVEEIGKGCPNIKVSEAENVESAWEKIKEEMPDVVASCLFMNHELTGIDLLELAKSNFPDMKVILFSSYITNQFDAEELLRKGAYAAIPKTMGIAEHLNSAFSGMYNF